MSAFFTISRVFFMHDLKCFIIELPVPFQESKRTCMCVRGMDLDPVSTIVRLDFGVFATLIIWRGGGFRYLKV